MLGNDNNDGMRDKLITAAVIQFEAQKTRAQANLLMYLDRGTGVPEHPDVVDEVVNLTKQIAEADECIKTLSEYAGFTRHYTGIGGESE